MLTGYGNIPTAVAAIKEGAIDYLAKPADAEDVEAALLAATMNFKSQYDTSLDDYNNYQTLYWEETDVSLLMLYKEKRDASRKDMDAANSSYQVFSGLLAVGWLYSAVTAYLEGPGTLKYLERKRQATSNMDMNVAFNHEQQKMQLEFSIPLR